jgi:23S rRNA (adenine2503-C2)-methyltransferase
MVFMPSSKKNTLCISTQIGCARQCSFCATAGLGLKRNLTHAELQMQIFVAYHEFPDKKLTNIVLMGMGEPLDNLDQVLKMIRIANAPWGLGIGYRHITISTCGLVPGLERLRQEGIPVNLSVSLHAADDAVRKRLQPGASQYSVSELMGAVKRYQETTRRRVTFEYGLVDGINDQVEHAVQLSKLLRGHMAHVNLIPINPISQGKSSQGFRRSKPEAVQAFYKELHVNHIPATIRREMGTDIAAACGQLRLQRNAVI